MTQKKRLGVFIPVRPDNHLQIDFNNSGVGVGCFREDIHTPLREALRAADHVDLVEGLNFRKALIESGKVYVDDFCLNDLDRFFWYCEIDRRQGSFDLECLRTLSRDTEVIREPNRFEAGLDKYQAHLALRDAGAKVPDFVLFDYRVPEKMGDVLEKWGAGVLKPRRGGWGKGVTLIDSISSLRDAVGYVRSISGHSPDKGFFLERYYDNDPTRWASITMINGEIAFGYRKVAAKFHDFGGGRVKVEDIDEVGGGVVLADLTPQHIEQAHIACEAMGLGLIGFDMIWTEQGPVIVDENTSPGNYTDLYRELGKDPAKLYADWILEGL